MENATTPTPISMEQRLDFWRTTLLRVGRVSPRHADKEIASLIAMIDSGALGGDLVREHGAVLLTYALAHWPGGDNSHWAHAYGNDKRPTADLLAYQPGQEWSGAHAPLERVVAALLRAGADPWKAPFIEQDGYLELENGKTYPPAWFILRDDDLPAASFHAFMRHPSCPPMHDLVRHRDEKGRSLVELAAINHPEALEEFLKRGADPNMVGSKDLPLLFHAGTRKSVKLLVAAGAQTDLVDARGNSLEVFWGLKHSLMASSLISELPKRAKDAPPPKAALATILVNLDEASRTNVRSVLDSMKSPASYRWEVNGQQVNLLEALAASAVFGPIAPKAKALDELSNKKYGWSEEDRKVLHLVRALCKAPDASDAARDLGKSLDKKLGDAISPEDMAAVITRLQAVHEAISSGPRLDLLESNDRSRILFAWDFLLRKSGNGGETWGVETLPVFQAMQHLHKNLLTVSAHFADQLFRCLAPFVEQNPVPESTWKFWTAVGICSGNLEDPAMYELWKSTLPHHDPEWFKDERIHFQLQRRTAGKLRANLEELVLQHASDQAPIPVRAGPRL